MLIGQLQVGHVILKVSSGPVSIYGHVIKEFLGARAHAKQSGRSYTWYARALSQHGGKTRTEAEIMARVGRPGMLRKAIMSACAYYGTYYFSLSLPA